MRMPVPNLSGLRGVGAFWAAFLMLAAGGGLTLQLLGPPSRHDGREIEASSPARAAATASHAAAGHAPPRQELAEHETEGRGAAGQPTEPAPVSTLAVTARPGRNAPGGPIAPPDPALLEPYRDSAARFLPKVASDGRTPGAVYARGFDQRRGTPRVAVIVAGVGLNAADSEAAIRALPAEVTLAISPYAVHPEPLLDLARAAGHEYLLSLPLEPQGYPLNDAGDHALLTGVPPEQNRERLEWVLSRVAGYAGTTNALGLLRGERFAGSPAQMAPVLDALRQRGLFYVDARTGQAGTGAAWGRPVDTVIDEPADRAVIEARLADLEQTARDKGSAVGLVEAVRPVTMERLAAWANGLAAKGIALAPVSALVLPPAAAPGPAALADTAAAR